jgi:hypothetical protein
MKIDLYNNHDVFIQQQKQNDAIAHWCKRRGITPRDLFNHPRIKDVQFLIEFRDEFHNELKQSASYLATYNAYWGIVYAQQKRLKPKAFAKFEKVTLGCLDIRKQNQIKLSKIQSLRHTPGTSQKQNTDHDKEAKGSNSVQSNVYEKNIQRGGREVQELLPWE